MSTDPNSRLQEIKTNLAVTYQGPRKVEVKNTQIPSFNMKMPTGETKRFEHGAIIKLIASNICGSDLHPYRGKLPLKKDMPLGHEMTGEVIAVGSEVEFIKPGDIVSVPFNIGCGKCSMCKSEHFSMCLSCNPTSPIPGAGYGYPMLGDYPGGQSEYNIIPYADFNLLKIPHKELAMEKILDISLLSDVLPTSYHGVVNAHVQPGNTVYVSGFGPIGASVAAICSQLFGAVPIVGEVNKERLERAKKLGCMIVDLTKSTPIGDQLDELIGIPFTDCAIDAVGFEARASGAKGVDKEEPCQPLFDCIQATRVGGFISVPGFYPAVPDPNSSDLSMKTGYMPIQFGLAWNKGISFNGLGQCPVQKYNRKLMTAILFDKLSVTKWVNTTVISLDDAPEAYKQFDLGVSKKFVIDPHNMIPGKKGLECTAEKLTSKEVTEIA